MRNRLIIAAFMKLPYFGRMRDYVIERIAPANSRATP